MHILHICTYYIGNQLYRNLIQELSKKGINQSVFIPLKEDNLIGKNQLPSKYNTVDYYYRNILKNHDRFFYFHKTKKQLKEIEHSIISKKNIDFIHAHTVFSDGGTAYKLNKKYGINYIVNVRNTDINFFYKYGLHLRPFMYKVLKNASKIVFLSHAYKNALLSLLPESIVEIIKSKCVVVPNGIDDYWHSNVSTQRSLNSFDEIRLLFIGTINKNKNLSKVLEVCSILRNKNYRVTLNVIGDGPEKLESIKMTKKLGISNNVIFHDFISEKSEIATIMDQSDIFIMPSISETFGLVYIEAMSKGLPVIYSKEQGIDGFFIDGNVGFPVDPNNEEEIANSVLKILNQYNRMSRKCLSSVSEFSWNKISLEYKNKIYLTEKQT